MIRVSIVSLLRSSGGGGAMDRTSSRGEIVCSDETSGSLPDGNGICRHGQCIRRQETTRKGERRREGRE